MNKKIILLFIGAIAISAGIIAYLQYNKPHINYEKASVDLTITADALLQAFEHNETIANQQYLNRVVEVSGKPISAHTNPNGSVTIALLDELQGVSCTFDSAYVSQHLSSFAQVKEVSSVVIKGRCDGFLTDVRLSKCSFTHK